MFLSFPISSVASECCRFDPTSSSSPASFALWFANKGQRETRGPGNQAQGSTGRRKRGYVVYRLHGLSGRSTVWANGTQNSWLVACSKRSDSGERCGVEKAMKSRGGLGREVRFPLSPLLLPRFYFFALPFTLHRSPLSERLEQATVCPPDRPSVRTTGIPM